VLKLKAGRMLNFAEDDDNNDDDDSDDDLFITCIYRPIYFFHVYVSVGVPEMKTNKTCQTFKLLCLYEYNSYLYSVGRYCKALPAIKLCNKPLLSPVATHIARRRYIFPHN
jgi:hypothetical protein